MLRPFNVLLTMQKQIFLTNNKFGPRDLDLLIYETMCAWSH